MDTRICDRLYIAIRLLLWGSVNSARLLGSESSPGSSRSGSCLAFVTHSVKCPRHLSVEFVSGDGVLLIVSVWQP